MTIDHQNGIVTSNHVKVDQDSWVWKEVGTFPKTCKYSHFRDNYEHFKRATCIEWIHGANHVGEHA